MYDWNLTQMTFDTGTWQTGATMYVRYDNLTSERSQRARYLFNQNPTHSGYTKEHTYANLYAFPATSRNLSAEAGIRGKRPTGP